MLAPTHSVFGVFLTLIILAVFGIQWGLHWTIILFAILGSVIPDIDHPRSVIGKIFYPVAVFLERRFGHRTVTHSLIGWAIATAIFAVATLLIILTLHTDKGLSLRWLAAFSISYFSHLILDMFTPRGSQMFWPDNGRDVIPGNPKFRPQSGGRAEIFIFAVLLALMFLALPVSKYGIGTTLRWLLATPGSAISEFKTLKTHAYIEFKGIMNETRTPVEGKAEILDVNNKRLVILYKGDVYTLSDELAADITASHARIDKTDIPIKTVHKVFKDESRERLLSQIPEKSLVSGTVHLPQDMQIIFPGFPGTFKTMEQKGNDLILIFASKDQIKSLALNEFFDLQTKKDEAQLATLNARWDKICDQINEARSGKGLTPLGEKLLRNSEDIQKQKIQLAELKSQLDEVNVQIDELKLKLNNRKLVFSGNVYIRESEDSK